MFKLVTNLFWTKTGNLEDTNEATESCFASIDSGSKSFQGKKWLSFYWQVQFWEMDNFSFIQRIFAKTGSVVVGGLCTIISKWGTKSFLMQHKEWSFIINSKTFTKNPVVEISAFVQRSGPIKKWTLCKNWIIWKFRLPLFQFSSLLQGRMEKPWGPSKQS